MFTIRSYTDTECELNVAKARLDLLIDRRTKLYTKYFPVTSNTKEVIVDGGNCENDKMALYLHELNEIDYGTGMSLAQEIVYQQCIVDNLNFYLKIIDNSLSKMKGIEYQLFYEITHSNKSITQVVDSIAEQFDKDTQTIWKNYYRKIKKYVKKLKCTVKIQ